MKEINKNETQNLLQAHDKMFYYLLLKKIQNKPIKNNLNCWYLFLF